MPQSHPSRDLTAGWPNWAGNRTGRVGVSGADRQMKSAVNQAKKTYNQAVDTSGMLGSEAQGIGSNLTPFLTSEMLHPEGLGQEGIGAETGAALGGAGGAMSGFSGGAAQRAAASRNAGGYGAALADAARERMKAAAGRVKAFRRRMRT